MSNLVKFIVNKNAEAKPAAVTKAATANETAAAVGFSAALAANAACRDTRANSAFPLMITYTTFKLYKPTAQRDDCVDHSEGVSAHDELNTAFYVTLPEPMADPYFHRQSTLKILTRKCPNQDISGCVPVKYKDCPLYVQSVLPSCSPTSPFATAKQDQFILSTKSVRTSLPGLVYGRADCNNQVNLSVNDIASVTPLQGIAFTDGTSIVIVWVKVCDSKYLYLSTLANLNANTAGVSVTVTETANATSTLFSRTVTVDGVLISTSSSAASVFTPATAASATNTLTYNVAAPTNLTLPTVTCGCRTIPVFGTPAAANGTVGNTTVTINVPSFVFIKAYLESVLGKSWVAVGTTSTAADCTTDTVRNGALTTAELALYKILGLSLGSFGSGSSASKHAVDCAASRNYCCDALYDVESTWWALATRPFIEFELDEKQEVDIGSAEICFGANNQQTPIKSFKLIGAHKSYCGTRLGRNSDDGYLPVDDVLYENTKNCVTCCPPPGGSMMISFSNVNIKTFTHVRLYVITTSDPTFGPTVFGTGANAGPIGNNCNINGSRCGADPVCYFSIAAVQFFGQEPSIGGLIWQEIPHSHFSRHHSRSDYSKNEVNQFREIPFSVTALNSRQTRVAFHRAEDDDSDVVKAYWDNSINPEYLVCRLYTQLFRDPTDAAYYGSNTVGARQHAQHDLALHDTLTSCIPQVVDTAELAGLDQDDADNDCPAGKSLLPYAGISATLF